MLGGGAGARAQRAEHVLVEVEGREDDDADTAGLGGGSDLPGRVDAVEHGHAHVHQQDVGPGGPRDRDGLRAVGGLADYRQPGCGGDDAAESDPDEGLIIGHRDGDGHPRPPPPDVTAPVTAGVPFTVAGVLPSAVAREPAGSVLVDPEAAAAVAPAPARGVAPLPMPSPVRVPAHMRTSAAGSGSVAVT